MQLNQNNYGSKEKDRDKSSLMEPTCVGKDFVKGGGGGFVC